MKGHIKPVLDEDGYVFVVGPLDGPHRMMWRIWADKNSNVYLTPRPPPRQTLRFKVSLHTPRPYSPLGTRNESLTKEFFQTIHPGNPIQLRHMRQCEGDVSLSENFQFAYRLVFPRAHLRPMPYPPNPGRLVQWLDIPWPEPETPRQALGIDLVFQTSGNSPSTEDMPDELQAPDVLSGILQTWELLDGRRLHLVIRGADGSPIEGNLRPAAEQVQATLREMASRGEPVPEDLRVTLWFEQPMSVRGCAEVSWAEMQKLLVASPPPQPA